MDYSDKVDVFQEHYLPESQVTLAGYAALIHKFALKVPLPEQLSAISHKHNNYQHKIWQMYTPRYQPEPTLYSQLIFALKHEGINLWILHALFTQLSTQEITALIQIEPLGIYSRRLWFLYEWLLDTKLPLPDIADTKINYVDIIDPKLQYPGPRRRVRRQRITNNLPGMPNFCPLIRRTDAIEKYIKTNLQHKAEQVFNSVHPDLLMRAAGFLLLKDSKASYAIEGETPAQTRAERWGRALAYAGTTPLTDAELLRLQTIVINDFRFTHKGYRVNEGFIGEHDRLSSEPIPDHISAKVSDLPLLISALLQTNEMLSDSDFHPVLAATIIAFGFLFIHPFEDGNGRIHRYLIHHVLAEKGFVPQGIVFPVSAVILTNIKTYRILLESYSTPRLKFINWRPTTTNNVEIQNDTLNLYRYFDATQFAEFLFSCIETTILDILPEEVIYLKKYDLLRNFIKNYLDMPDSLVNLLILFLQQNAGRLSNRAKTKEFQKLTPDEIAAIEEKFNEIFQLH